MPKSKNSKGDKLKVNFFTAKVHPVVFFILDFVLTTVFLLLLDLLWYNVIRHEEFHFGTLNVILPLVLSITATVTLVYNEKKK